MLLDGYKIKGLELGGYWIDVRDPEMLTAAANLVQSP
jgi:hypothetical protein